MFTVCVRDHVMIAHSLRGATFGPAQRLHGATYVVDVCFRRPGLNADGIVVDIGAAAGQLRRVLADLNYRNLDEHLPEINTTTEALSKAIFDRMVAAIRRGDLGEDGPQVASIEVVLHESHIAWASYEGPVAAASDGE